MQPVFSASWHLMGIAAKNAAVYETEENSSSQEYKMYMLMISVLELLRCSHCYWVHCVLVCMTAEHECSTKTRYWSLDSDCSCHV